jgi:hypothetical protein
MQNQMGASTVDGFARMYLLPGVGHCGGGEGLPNIDLVTQVTGWVEQGSAPGAVTSYRLDAAGAVAASRPVYPYPAVAQYKGSGDYKDAANWASGARCTTPARLPGPGRCSTRRTRRSNKAWLLRRRVLHGRELDV